MDEVQWGMALREANSINSELYICLNVCLQKKKQQGNLCPDSRVSWFSSIFRQSSKLYVELHLLPHRE